MFLRKYTTKKKYIFHIHTEFQLHIMILYHDFISRSQTKPYIPI